jgi:hypothetical protein
MGLPCFSPALPCSQGVTDRLSWPLQDAQAKELDLRAPVSKQRAKRFNLEEELAVSGASLAQQAGQRGAAAVGALGSPWPAWLACTLADHSQRSSSCDLNAAYASYAERMHSKQLRLVTLVLPPGTLCRSVRQCPEPFCCCGSPAAAQGRGGPQHLRKQAGAATQAAAR